MGTGGWHPALVAYFGLLTHQPPHVPTPHPQRPPRKSDHDPKRRRCRPQLEAVDALSRVNQQAGRDVPEGVDVRASLLHEETGITPLDPLSRVHTLKRRMGRAGTGTTENSHLGQQICPGASCEGDCDVKIGTTTNLDRLQVHRKWGMSAYVRVGRDVGDSYLVVAFATQVPNREMRRK
jgi:hypothetical protein